MRYLTKHYDIVKAKIEAVGVDINDVQASKNALSQTMLPVFNELVYLEMMGLLTLYLPELDKKDTTKGCKL